MLSRYFKADINTDYGIYSETGEEAVVEVVDQNAEYEQAAGREDQAQQTGGKPVDEYENWQDEYDYMG